MNLGEVSGWAFPLLAVLLAAIFGVLQFRPIRSPRPPRPGPTREAKDVAEAQGDLETAQDEIVEALAHEDPDHRASSIAELLNREFLD